MRATMRPVHAYLEPRHPSLVKLPAPLTALPAAIGTTFCISGLLKIVNHHEFEAAVTSYGLLPDTVVEIVTLLLPQAEVCLGLLLAFGVTVKAVSALLTVMLVIFTSLGAAAWAKGQAVDCGCFPLAGQEDPIGALFFIRNGVLTLACLWIAITFKAPTASQSRLGRQGVISYPAEKPSTGVPEQRPKGA